MAGAWLAGGWSGVMLLTGAGHGGDRRADGRLAAALAGARCRRSSRPWSLGLACVAPSLLARPHILVLPVLALWTIGLLKARAESQAPSLSGWCSLMALWANLHSSFIVGLGLAGALGAGGALDFKAWRRRNLTGWAAFWRGSLVAALVTPHGIDGPRLPAAGAGHEDACPASPSGAGPDFLKLRAAGDRRCWPACSPRSGAACG